MSTAPKETKRKSKIQIDPNNRIVIKGAREHNLKNVSVGYTLPRRALRRMHFDTMRVYVSADNIWTWTKYTGPDPEVSTRNSVLTPGFDWSAYPRAFGLTAGVSFTF